MPVPSRESLLQLLKDARIQGAELDRRISDATNPDYWRALAPELHVCARESSFESFFESGGVNAAAIARAVESRSRDGYFRLPGVIAPAIVARLNAAIDAVVSRGWLASFVFMYDEAWQCARSPSLQPILASSLGPGYRQLCHVWTHVVKPVVGDAGWSPHTDGNSETNPRKRLSVWIGLTDATLDNGCMHVISRRASDSSPDLVRRFQQTNGQLARAEVVTLLHATHALETAPGDALGWDFDVIHWGGIVRREGLERRGFSFEFLAGDEPPFEVDGEVTAMAALPAFDVRLRAVANGVITYRRFFEPIVGRYADFADVIKQKFPTPPLQE